MDIIYKQDNVPRGYELTYAEYLKIKDYASESADVFDEMHVAIYEAYARGVRSGIAYERDKLSEFLFV